MSAVFYARQKAKQVLLIMLLMCSIAFLDTNPRSNVKDRPDVERMPKKFESNGENIDISLSGVFFDILMQILIIELMILIVVRVIVPIFVDYSPLQQPLRRRVDDMADRLNFPSSEIRVVGASSYSMHSNAMFLGFIFNKHIFVYDTLQSRDDGFALTDEEVEAVVGHEFGHWKLGHVFIQMLANALYEIVFLLVAFFFFQAVFTHTEFILFLRILSFLSSLVGVDDGGFFRSFISRHLEYKADKFAVEDLQKGLALRSGLVKLHKQNLMFPVRSKLYYLWYNSHPLLEERVDAIDEMEEQQRIRRE